MTGMDLLEFRDINGPDPMPKNGAIWLIGLFSVYRDKLVLSRIYSSEISRWSDPTAMVGELICIDGVFKGRQMTNNFLVGQHL